MIEGRESAERTKGKQHSSRTLERKVEEAKLRKARQEKMNFDKVAADHFYKDDGDKVKQNWLLYEYANILFSKIEERPTLAAYRKKESKDNIEAFCVYFSKRLRQSISNAHTRQATGVMIDARYVYEFYPDNSYAQTQRLLEAAMAAWEEHLLSCVSCQNQCLTDGFALTDMFDNLEKTGWPTI
jgi:hypothetical protein